MEKEIRDIKAVKINEGINLGNKRKSKTRKKENIIYKTKTPIKEVKDIFGEAQEDYSYIKGEKFKSPKFLGNIIRVLAAGFIILLLINTANVYFIGKALEKDVSENAKEGLNFLIDAGKNTTEIQFSGALKAFDKALSTFNEAKNDLWFISTDTSIYSENANMGQAVNALLNGGKYFAIAGKYFLEGIEEFNKIPLYFVSKNENPNAQTPSITDCIKNGLKQTNLAIEQISLASKEMEKVDESSLPTNLEVRIKFAKTKVFEISKVLEATKTHFPALLKLLGDEFPHRYLIILQNNNEIRPTGGFIGSYVIMDINEGYIEKLETHDVYDIDGMYGELIEPPEEFKTFTSNWRFRDANYSTDFPISAKKLKWFLEREGGPSVDTVIAINQGLLKDMLSITGPVQVGNFGKLTQENYNLLLSFVIESKAWGEEDPKHILKIFIPAFKEAILKTQNISKVSSKLYKAVQQKHILMYSSDEEIQGLFDAIGISGRVYEPKEGEDYLNVTNFGAGTKSEQFMEEKIRHETQIESDGSIINKITLTRSHLWTDEIYYQWKKILEQYGFYDMPDDIIDILGRGENKVGTRIYVPEGSVLVESNGGDIATKYDKDLKKTYFFTQMNTKAGETSEIWIKYKLPFKLDFKPTATYKLFVDKQPGSRGSIFTKTVTTSPELENLALYPVKSKITQEGIVTYATDLVYDRYFSGIWEK